MPTSSGDTRRFLRDLGLLLGIPIVGIVGLVFWLHPWPNKYEVPPPRSVFDQASGTWGWSGHDTCGVNHHTILFDSLHDVMRIAHARPWRDSTGYLNDTTVYDISQSSPHHIRGLIRGETRKTPFGAPVVWDLVLTSPHSYQWKQAGFWGIVGYTRPIKRCPPPSQWPYPVPE
jgi:hypothetical protein